MLRKVGFIFFSIFMYAVSAPLPFQTFMPKVSKSYDSILLKTWEGIKKRNVDPYDIKMIHRPYSESPGDAVSEGVGYGMILALYCNDQDYFNKIWDAGEEHLWNDEAKSYNWRIHLDGNVEFGAATDAEEDVAAMLIFADLLVQKGLWKSHTSPLGATYSQRANDLVNNIWNAMVEDGKYLKPGDGWGGKDLLNPGYFAPAYYRIFDEFEEHEHDWNGLIDECYNIIEKSSGYPLGLIPDFMNADGEPKAAGYNTYAESRYLYKDAIRVYWRIGTDFLWYGEPRAEVFLNNALAFIKSPEKSNFYQLDGTVVPDTDSFILGNEVERPRAEHSHLTVGMWACAAIAVGDSSVAEAFSDRLLSFYETGADYWGRSSDPDGEDTLHNEMYFDQFLAWFGASMLSGTFSNIWEIMKDPDPTLPLGWKVSPKLSTKDINASIEPLSISAEFNKPARWNVKISHESSPDTRVFAGTENSISISWNGLSSDGKPMKQGYYQVTISARGLEKTFSSRVWLGKAFDLMENNRLLVDDFRDEDLYPFIGNKWTSYLDNNDRAGTSTSASCNVKNIDNVKKLVWSYHLEGQNILGFDPYAALEWNCKNDTGNLNLTGLDTLIVIAKSESPVDVSVQLITSDIGDYTYFEDSVSFTSTEQEYKFIISEFKQRLNGQGVTLDLSKLTGIRFQVQYPDGNENAITISKVYFTGNLENIYSPSPDYIGSKVKKPVVTGKLSEKFKYTVSNKGIQFSIPLVNDGAMITLFDITGKVIARTQLRGSSAFIPFNNKCVANRICFLQVKGNGIKYAEKINLLRM
ncbi:MAG: glycosyl hydrolase family 8 [Fibrobacter sp.]|nr:glycosyl hydrolase family 8 [Fibrobacter sp.]